MSISIGPDKALFNSLGRSLRAASHVAGVNPLDIKATAWGVITLGDTGVALFWISCMSNSSEPGWLVRETYTTTKTDGSKFQVTDTVVEIPQQEFIRAAKCSLMLVLERRMDSFLKN